MNQNLKWLIRKIEQITGARIAAPHALGTALEIEHLRKTFKLFNVDCVFDVGANEGQYASMLRQDVNFLGKIISFEPIPELAETLRQTSSKDNNWFVEELALDRESGSAQFNIATRSAFSSLLPSKEETAFGNAINIARKIPVEKERIDNIFCNLKDKIRFTNPFLKLDTQGNDLSVAVGAGNLLRNFVGIQSELSVKTAYYNSEGYYETIKFFQRNGFELAGNWNGSACNGK